MGHPVEILHLNLYEITKLNAGAIGSPCRIRFCRGGDPRKLCFGSGVVISISLFPTASAGLVKWMGLLGVVGVARVGGGSLGLPSGSANDSGLGLSIRHMLFA